MSNVIGNNDPYCLALAGGYLCLVLFSSFHLSRIALYGHNPLSFQALFGVLTFFWTTMRVIFFGLNIRLSEAALFLLYWFPGDLQWAVYLLIVVFYLYWIQDEDALMLAPSRNAKRVRTLINWAFVTLCVASFIKTFIILDIGKTSSHSWSSLNCGSHVVGTFQWLTICLVYTWIMISVQMRRRAQEQVNVDCSPTHGILNNTIIGTKYMIVFWLILTSRMVYHWLLQYQLWTLKISIEEDNSKTIGLTAFIFLILWELVPTLMVLWCFRSIPSTEYNLCVCWHGRNYHRDYDYDSFGNYIPPSVTNDQNCSPSSTTLLDSPPHLSRRLRYDSSNLRDEDSMDEKLNLLPVTKSASRPIKKLISAHDCLAVNSKTPQEIGPEFSADVALARSPPSKSSRKKSSRKKRSFRFHSRIFVPK